MSHSLHVPSLDAGMLLGSLELDSYSNLLDNDFT